MKSLKDKLAQLINVKSIITIILTVVFAILSLKGVVTTEQFVNIFSIVIAFYFGTQREKKDNQN
jgi:uncharacterized protein (DUF486 family)